MKLRRRKTLKLRRATPAAVGFRRSAHGCAGWECFFSSVEDAPGASAVLFTGSPTLRYAKAVFNRVAPFVDLCDVQKKWRWHGANKTIRPDVLAFLQWIFREQPARREIPSFRKWSQWQK